MEILFNELLKKHKEAADLAAELGKRLKEVWEKYDMEREEHIRTKLLLGQLFDENKKLENKCKKLSKGGNKNSCESK